MASLNPYGKLNEVDQERLLARQKTKKRITIIALSSIVLAAIVVGVVLGTSHGNKKSSKIGDAQSISTSVKAVCDGTLYPSTCYSTLAPLVQSSQVNPEQLFKLSVQLAINELSQASQKFSQNEGVFGNITVPIYVAALENCCVLFDLALDHLNNSLSSTVSLVNAIDDFTTWLSTAGTCQQTCIDGFQNAPLQTSVESSLRSSTELTSIGLAIISEIGAIAGSFNLRRLLGVPNDDFPKWVSMKDRKLLQSRNLKNNADMIVAKDKSGNYTKIGDALQAVPSKSNKRFVIYVKKGAYVENVIVDKTKWNVMMIGDGMDTTTVSGSLNVVDGTPTFSSATFSVFGQGFIAQDMGFLNTAGAIKQQAVALMSNADQSIFYRCKMDAFQDTLYTHANRQFYRECKIYGTVDFIFGNSAAVFQNCNIFPKVPIPGQQNTITAQGKIDPNQNTGISIQNCTVSAFGNLSAVDTYLGRPWKNYSTTIFMQSTLESLIKPSGWLPWMGTTAPNTIFYAEYQNKGPGASAKNRVKWKGLKLNLGNKDASKFTVKQFINGNKWIPSNVPYNPSL